jgi:hypothetical protein
LGYGGSLGAALDDAAAEEPLPDDVPLTRAQLQAKVGHPSFTEFLLHLLHQGNQQ